VARRWRSRRERLGWIVGLAMILPASGCAAVLGGYELAPNGLTRDEDAYRRALASEAAAVYRATIEGKRVLPDDDLLRLLYAGTAGRYAGAHEESSRLLDVAAYVAEDRVTLSLSRELLSMLTSDRALPFVPSPTERLMIPYFAALNFLDAGNAEAAAVEARRIEALLDQRHDGTPPDQRPPDARFLHYFAGAVFEAAGDWNAADVAYRRAGDLAGSSGASDAAATAPPDPGDGDVIVLVERGFAPHRVEQSVIVVLPPSRAKMLMEGSAAEKAAAAMEAAAHILLTASTGHNDRYRSGTHLQPWLDDSEDDSDGTPYLLRVAWPVLFQETGPGAVFHLWAGDATIGEVARLDLAAGIRRDFDDQRATVVARAVARAVTKAAISAAVEHSVGKKDESAGQLAGLLTNLGTMATERADTRGWHLLPGDIALYRLRLPAGSHDIVLETHDSAGHPVSMGTVTVRPGRTSFVSTRLWH
jgi:uncharacterized protein